MLPHLHSGLQPVTFLLRAILIGFIAASFSIAATNGGIGSYPVSYLWQPFPFSQLPEEPSVAFGWIMWASQTLSDYCFWGLIFNLSYQFLIENKRYRLRFGLVCVSYHLFIPCRY